jgi:hypothetical protein
MALIKAPHCEICGLIEQITNAAAHNRNRYPGCDASAGLWPKAEKHGAF